MSQLIKAPLITRVTLSRTLHPTHRIPRAESQLTFFLPRSRRSSLAHCRVRSSAATIRPTRARAGAYYDRYIHGPHRGMAFCPGAQSCTSARRAHLNNRAGINYSIAVLGGGPFCPVVLLVQGSACWRAGYDINYGDEKRGGRLRCRRQRLIPGGSAKSGN